MLFLELRPLVTAGTGGGARVAGPAKYWACSPLTDWRAGPLQLQLYKAPPVYALALQRNNPKLNSFVQLTILP